MRNFMMNSSTLIVACIGLILCAIAWSVDGVSVSCMMAYEEGGAPAVFSLPECAEWFLSTEISQNSTRNCQFATLQGRREYQEDRVTCNLDMKFPISCKNGADEVTIGIAAIFDGHGGDEASDMASRRLLDYFFMHVVFNAYKQTLRANKENHETHIFKSFQGTLQMIDHRSLHQILEKALLKTIEDIDSEFSKEAMDKGYVSGSTGIVVLLVNDQSLIANVGDSKALMCSQRNYSQHNPKGASTKEIYAEELTSDHHPDREDEKARIEAAGGFVRTLGVPRVNGILAVSRSIGDLLLKRYGVIAEPEITGWRQFTPKNNYLMMASDGIFETLTPQEVCDLIHHKSICETMSSSSLADCIVRVAFKTGSTDNLSAIVISDLLNTNL